EPGGPAQDCETPPPPWPVARPANQFPGKGSADQRPSAALLPGAFRHQDPGFHRSRFPHSLTVLSQARSPWGGPWRDPAAVQGKHGAECERHVGTVGAAPGGTRSAHAAHAQRPAGTLPHGPEGGAADRDERHRLASSAAVSRRPQASPSGVRAAVSLMLAGGMADWSMAVVLKTTKVQAFGGSNPSPSAQTQPCERRSSALLPQPRDHAEA